jgi:hypothetical protein
MTVRHFKEKVQKDYIRHVTNFKDFLGRSPDTATSEDLRLFQLYPVHVSTRKSFGLMTRKLSVTESRKLLQFLGTLSRKKSSVASANCPHVA